MCDIKNSNLTGCCDTAQIQSWIKVHLIVACQWPSDPFPLEICLLALCLLYGLMHESKLFNNLWSSVVQLELLVFSTIVAPVIKGNIRSAICTALRLLKHLNMSVYINGSVVFYACQFFQCYYWLEDEDGYCTGGCLLIMPRGLEKKEQDRNENLYEQCGGWVCVCVCGGGG